MAINNVTVAGGGVLGSQIAFQAAYCGKDVTIWLRSEGSIGRTQPKLDKLLEDYTADIERMAAEADAEDGYWCRGLADRDSFDKDACLAAAQRAHDSIKLELDMAKAVADADVVIESMAENEKDKVAFFQALAPLLPQTAVLCTNSSSLLPSKFTKHTGCPERYLAMHFANTIWKNNIAEVMKADRTNQASFDTVMQLARDIRMIPLPVNKEKAGYLLNSQLIPWLFSGMDLVVNGISDPESVDIAWTLGTGAPKGPFQVLDTVGITTAYNIVQNYVKIPSFLAPYNFKGMSKMLKAMIDEGKLGKASGQGFYTYE